MSPADAPAPAAGKGLGRRLLADTGQAAVGRVVSMAVWTLLVPRLLHGLGPEGFALWSLFFALTGYLSALDLGFSQGTLRHVAAAHARGDGREAGEFALVGLLGYLVLGAAWFALTPLVRGPVLDLLRIGAAHRAEAEFAILLGPVAFACSGASLVMSASLQGWRRFDLANGVTLSAVFVQAGGALWALERGWGLPGVLRAIVVGSLAGAVVGLLLLRVGARGFHWGTPAGAARRVREAVAFGGPLQVGNILGVAHQQLDKLLLSRYVALALVSPYELGLRTAMVLGSIPQQMLLALLPAASALHATSDLERLRLANDRAGRWVMAVTAAVASGFIAGAPRLLAAWLGTVPEGAERCVVGLTLAMAAAMTASTATVIARAMGRTRLEAEYSGFGLAIHLAVGLWLVPRWSLDGALLATGLANVLASLLLLWRFGRITGWGLARPLGRTVLPALLALAATSVAGRWLADRLPEALGLAGWGWAILASATPAAVTFVALALVGHVPVAELRALGRPVGSPPRRG